MRRSKSNPAKYSRNYKSISQRRMTNHQDEDEDEKEMERLRTILKQSSSQIQQQKDIEETKKKENNIIEEDDDNDNYYDNDDDDIIMLPSKKKKKKTSIQKIELTPEELRRAKLAQKNANRKLKQLEVRATQKRKRAELYTKLQESSISMEERRLLSSSSTLGKRETKKETLKRLLQKERTPGMSLTEEEQDMLYTTRRIVNDSDITNIEMKKIEDEDDMDSSKVVVSNNNQEEENNEDSSLQKRKKKKKKKKKQKVEEGERSNNGIDVEKQLQLLEESKTKKADIAATNDDDKNDDSSSDKEEEKEKDDDEEEEETKTTTTAVTTTTNEDTTTTTPMNFAAQMMASLTQLKTKIEDEKPEESNEIVPSSELERIAIEEEKRHKDVIYKPSNPVLVQTAAQMGLKGKNRELKKVMEIKRPEDIEKKRYELPISSMEYEIIDAITNHSVTILCSETGSGKSTQVPQFLYEAGFTLDDDDKRGGDKDNSYVIGITQPRRVAAVSTAKRVCYEMGFGNGQTIGRNNTVAYQTRYESAGLSSDKTKIKFMTDGILLQEIQSDLLLRKYSVIVLDEAHERNLNTDVLLGLLSVSIPLRLQASKESTSGIKPLKVIIMSATLRIEDFTKNDKLFSTEKPAIVRVPGRTHPVTIHHSRITELDKYEDVAYRKIIKIHTKLPKGGILVFLTGKQEIVRMVNKLRRRFNKKKDHRKLLKAEDDSIMAKNAQEEQHLRDMDDDDMDGDIFNDNHEEEEDDFDNMSDGEDEEEKEENNNEDNNNIPKNVLVLPLHSMLSVEEQAKVFASVPDNTRLIVVATNIAETSITIPNISYVVDTGRHKCRNYSATTGVASYDIMWISRAAADQRAGRAGRTGPGHCYRLYSSALYSRTMESFALPEVLTRPLEDVVLAMKAMNITHVSKFPFPTPPDKSQIHGAVRLLANLGCITLDDEDEKDAKYDGRITRLGSAVAKLPLGVRYGKMLLVAAQAGVLDYGIVMVALLSENSPFLHGQKENISDENEKKKKKKKEGDDDDDSDSDSDSDSSSSDDEEDTKQSRKEILQKWKHRRGDVLAGLLAVGAYSYAGRNAGGMTETVACRKFCETNGLNFAIMVRIHKMRLHLSRLAKARLSSCDGIAARTGGIVYDMRPPNKLQENLILQAVCSGLLDRIAMLAPPGSFANAEDNPGGYRSAYVSCIATIKDPLFVDPNSAVHTRDFRSLPTWVCFDTMIRKKNKTTGKDMVIMKRISPIDANWIGPLSTGSKLLQVGEPISTPVPSYDTAKDEIVCSVQTKFGTRGWEIPSLKTNMYIAISKFPKNKAKYVSDDSYRYFARFLLEGKVVPEIPKVIGDIGWNDDPAIITRNTPIRKVALLVSDLSSNGIDTVNALRKHWATIDKTFLSKTLLSNWINTNLDTTMKHNWMIMIQKQIEIYNTKNGIVPEKKKKKKKKRKRKSE